MAEEKTKGGSTIFRHQARERGFEAPDHESSASEEIVAHFEKHFGPTGMVFHELVSDLVHVDVHQLPPTAERPHWILFTTGMSDRPMTTPPGQEALQHAELMISLPGDWKLDQASFADERWYWPVRWLKMLARLPHEYQTWLGAFHTIPNQDPPQPFAPGTELAGVMLLPSLQWSQDAWNITSKDGRTIHFLALFPLTAAELDYKLERGGDALLDRFDEHELDEVIAPARASLC